jgi:hypothetical protein
MHSVRVALLADDGDDLAIRGTFLIAPSWAGPIVLGYRGFLERIRIALDPGIRADDAWLFFGGGD